MKLLDHAGTAEPKPPGLAQGFVNSRLKPKRQASLAKPDVSIPHQLLAGSV